MRSGLRPLIIHTSIPDDAILSASVTFLCIPPVTSAPLTIGNLIDFFLLALMVFSTFLVSTSSNTPSTLVANTILDGRSALANKVTIASPESMQYLPRPAYTTSPKVIGNIFDFDISYICLIFDIIGLVPLVKEAG